MQPRSIILNAFGPGECVTNEQLCARTGRHIRNVSAWVAYLRHRGVLKRCTPEGMVPVAHMKAELEVQTAETVVKEALASQPNSAFDVARRMGFEPWSYTERN